MDELSAAFEVASHPLSLRERRIEAGSGFATERLEFVTANGEAVRGIVVRPEHGMPAPAILYLHAHGGRYDIGVDELLAGRPALKGALGPLLARAGYVVLSIEMPAFGTRSVPGESARAKAALWRGGSMAGQMVGEQAAALGWLAERDDVQAERIGAFGISMGATLGYWLAAVEPRISAVAHLCCYADFAALIETGAHDLHGIYLTVPGLLGIASNGRIAGRVAPRPQLICIGDRDPLTPPEAVDRALAETREAYALAGAADRLIVHREAETGHEETPEMRRRVLDFFAQHLAPEQQSGTATAQG